MTLHLINEKTNARYPLTYCPDLLLSSLDNIEHNTLLTRVGRLWQSGKAFCERNKVGRSVVCNSIVILFQVWKTDLFIVVNNGEREYKMKVIADDHESWVYLTVSSSYNEIDLENEVVEFFEDYML